MRSETAGRLQHKTLRGARVCATPDGVRANEREGGQCNQLALPYARMAVRSGEMSGMSNAQPMVYPGDSMARTDGTPLSLHRCEPVKWKKSHRTKTANRQV